MVKRKPKRAWWNAPGFLWDMLWDRSGRGQLAIYCGLIVAVLALIGIIDRTFVSPDEITPVQARVSGWDADLAKATGPAIAASQPKFAVRDENGAIVSSKGSYALLSDFEKVANNGKFLLLPPQQTGDCASFAVTQGITRRHAVQIVNGKTREKLLSVFPPELYGLGRHQVGKDRFRGRPLRRGGFELNPGCTVGEILQGAQGYGLYSWEQAERDGFPYSGDLANVWGDIGPPKKVLDAARKVRLRAFSAVQTWDDLVDAIANGYPCPFGAQMVFRKDTRAEDGKRWLQFDDSVPPRNRGHAQVLIGVEDRPGKKPGCYCLGSWGPDAHDKPLNGEPPGGGWVSKDLVERYILTGHDAYAISDSETFEVKAEVADKEKWNAFTTPEIDDHELAKQLAAVDQPEEEPFMLEKRKMFSLPLLYCGLAVAGLMIAAGMFWKHTSPKARLMWSLVIGASMLVVADQASAGHRRRMARQQQSATQSTQCVCPPGACAAGQCAAYGCVNCQAATAAKPAEAGKPAVQYQWKCDGTRCRLVPVPAAEAKTPAAAPKKATAGGERLFRDNGDGTWTDAAEAKYEDEVAKEAVAFNAFGPMPDVVESKPNAWTAWPAERTLRSYADCYEHETDFILVIGSETDALMTLETADKPVAHELSHHAIEPGAYRIHLQNGQMVKETLGKSHALTVSSVRVRKQQ